MSTPDTPGSGGRSVKTLAIRLEPDTHAQLSLIAQLRSSTITDEIRTALETHIAAVKAAPELAGKADSVLEEIERDAAARRDAIATLFGTGADGATTKETEPRSTSPTPITSRTRGRKTGDSTAS